MKVRKALKVSVLILFLWAIPAATQASGSVPAGYSVTFQQNLSGISHFTMVRTKPDQVVNVARFRLSNEGESLSMRVVLSNEAVAGPDPRKERTSSMCRRVDCAVAVNGDFSILELGEPLGGVVIDGEMVRSPNPSHHQLMIGSDEALSAGRLEWKGVISPSDLRQITINGVNIERRENQLVVFTPAYAPSTDTNPFGTEVIAKIVDPPAPVRLGQTARLELLERRAATGNSPIAEGTIVLSGHGTAAAELERVWAGVQDGTIGRHVLMRLETTAGVWQTLGGTPILVREGRGWFTDDGTEFVRGRHPRTLVGWNPDGDILLVTVDGRQPGYSEGMSLSEAAALMIGLGATDAMNLDGGGSTTFVTNGNVVNRPSDRLVRRGRSELVVPGPSSGDVVLGNVERPRPVALTVIARPAKRSSAKSDPIAGGPLPKAWAMPVVGAGDPASIPGGQLPALVNEASREKSVGWLALIALALNLAAATAALIYLRTASKRRRATARQLPQG